MDVVGLTLAKQYTDSQRLAYAEHKIIEWYDTMDTLVIKADNKRGKIVKVSDEVIDIVSLKNLSYLFYVDEIGEWFVEGPVPGSAFTVEAYPAGGTVFVIDDMACIWTVSAEEVVEGYEAIVGTWFCNVDKFEGMEGCSSFGIIAEIEAIYPIDPKFISPVDALILNGADGKQYKLTVDETGALAATAIE